MAWYWSDTHLCRQWFVDVGGIYRDVRASALGYVDDTG
jgi:hypothetical protein